MTDSVRSATVSFQLNGAPVTLSIDPTTPLLWALRNTLGSTGTKFGCGAALCGACTVHVDGVALRACVTPVSAIDGKRLTTIEGLSGSIAEAVQSAWIALDVPQCGYCQSGQIMSAVALLAVTRVPTDAEIDQAMQGNICRCGTYPRIRAGIHQATETLRASPTASPTASPAASPSARPAR